MIKKQIANFHPDSPSNNTNKLTPKTSLQETKLPPEVLERAEALSNPKQFRDLLTIIPANILNISVPNFKRKVAELSPSGTHSLATMPEKPVELKRLFLKRYDTINNTKSYIASLDGGFLAEPQEADRLIAPPSFSSDGTSFRLINKDLNLKIIDLAAKPGTAQDKIISLHHGVYIDHFKDRPKFSPNDELVAAMSGSDCVVIREKTSEVLYTVEECSVLPRQRLFSPDGGHLVVNGLQLTLLSLKEGSVKPVDLSHLDDITIQPIFSPDGRLLHIRSRYGDSTHILDLTSEATKIADMKGHGVCITAMPDNSSFVFSKSQGSERSFEIHNVRNLKVPPLVLKTSMTQGEIIVSSDGRFFVAHNGRYYGDVVPPGSQFDSPRLEVWDLHDSASKREDLGDLPARSRPSISKDSKYLMAKNADGEPFYLNLLDPKNLRISLTHPSLQNMELDKNITAYFIQGTQKALVYSKDYLRVIDFSSGEPKERPIWASEKARAIFASDPDDSLPRLPEQTVYASDKFMNEMLYEPTMSKDGCFLATTHNEGIKLWDIEPDILTRF